MFIIRSQGFFYTDEYYAPGGALKQVVRTTYETRAAANQACAALIRKWVREEPLGNYLFDDQGPIDAVVAYFREQWPEDHGDADWDYEMTIPDDATDKQVDEIVKRMEITFAQVFEVEGDGEDAADDKDDDEVDDDEYPEDDLHYGPSPD